MPSPAPPANDEAADAEQRQREKKIIRRRLSGALIISLFALLVWQFGKSPPPIDPNFYHAVPAAPPALTADLNKTPTPPAATPPTVTAAATTIKSDTLLVGVFADKNNAKTLEEKLNAANLSTTIQDNGDTVKLYVVNLKNEAEKTRAQQRADDLLNQSTATPTPDAARTATAPVVLQVGAFSNRESAENVVRKLEAEKFKVAVEEVKRGGLTLLRVRVIGLQNKANAEIVKKRLIKIGFHDTQVINVL